MLPCFSKQYFGIECPGCGAQRSFISLLHGDFLDSLALYPGLIPLLFFCIVGSLSFVKSFRISYQLITYSGIFAAIVIVGHYIMKMAGWAPWYEHAAQCFHY